MRIHQLIPIGGDLVIYNEQSDHTVVLTPQGAVYNNEDTKDLCNMSVAFGRLFTSDHWRPASESEITAFRVKPNTHMMHLVWAKPAPKVRPKLTIVKKE